MLDIYPDFLKKQICELRELCRQFPVRFLASQCGVSYSTINRFINGNNVALSTFINLNELMYDENDEMNDKFKQWEGRMTRDEIDEQCNCSFNNDICSSCRKAELETIMELTALRAWKAKARPYLKMVTREPMDSTKHKQLTELLGGDDEND